MFSDGQESLICLGLMFQPHNKDEKTKYVLLYVRDFKLFERVSTGCKRNDYPLCIFEIRSFTHLTQPTPLHVTRHRVCSKMDSIDKLSILYTISSQYQMGHPLSYTDRKCPKPYWNIDSLPDYILYLDSSLWLIGNHRTDTNYLSP